MNAFKVQAVEQLLEGGRGLLRWRLRSASVPANGACGRTHLTAGFRRRRYLASLSGHATAQGQVLLASTARDRSGGRSVSTFRWRSCRQAAVLGPCRLCLASVRGRPEVATAAGYIEVLCLATSASGHRRPRGAEVQPYSGNGGHRIGF
jgi:hypothetical protein